MKITEEMAGTGKMASAWIIGIVLSAVPQINIEGATEKLQLVSLCLGILFLVLSCTLALIRIFKEK